MNGSENILFSVGTDIDLAGHDQAERLEFSEEKLQIRSASQSDESVRSYSRADVEDVRISSRIGCGVLEAKLAGAWSPVARYSNGMKSNFDSYLPLMKEWARGQNRPLILSHVENQPRLCDRCGTPLELPEQHCRVCLSKRRAVFRITSLIRPYWKPVTALGVLLAVSLVLDLTWPLFTRFLVDHVLNQPGPNAAMAVPRFGFRTRWQVLIGIVVLLAGIHIARGVLTGLMAVIGARVGNALTFDIRSQLVEKLQALSLSYYNKQDTGSLVGRISYDTDAIVGFVSQITSGFVLQILLVVFSLVMMFSLDPVLALGALVPVPFILGGATVYWRYLHPSFQKFWDRAAKQAGLLNGMLTGIRVVKAFAREEHELARFRAIAGQVRDVKDELDLKGAIFNPTMGVVFQAGAWIIWYTGGLGVLRQEVTLGTLMAFFGYLSLFYGPLGNLTNLTTWLTQFTTQMHRIYEILETPLNVSEPENPVADLPGRGEVELRDITFGYSRSAPVLTGLNLKIRAGETVGLVGRSGSGKTSLINLIYRFYDYDSGQILIDGVDIRSISMKTLRDQLSVVQQEPFLFRGTFSENICYGKLEASEKEIIEASRNAGCHEFVMSHALAYDTSVGERGQELSGGERQRISIARALLRPSAILILDEATSALDSESERAVQSALSARAGGRTKILIAHRLATLRSCDRICVLDQGRIVENGTHDGLMTLNGLYAGWVRLQSAGHGAAAHITPLANSWLSPNEVTIFEDAGGELRVQKGSEVLREVFPLRCFPALHPERFISLRCAGPDGRAREIGILDSLADWNPAVRAVLRKHLNLSYFYYNIERILEMKRSVGFVDLEVLTDRGERQFKIRDSEDSAKAFGAKGKLLIDIDDNLYVVRDVKDLPPRERELFTRIIFW